jgi:Na+-transporting NADH:ubiquinone oxidoreductase subunit C
MAEPVAIWRRFWARPNDDRIKTFGVAALVAFSSALVVSVASVALQPRQDAHLAAERQARMAAMLDALPGLRGLMEEAGIDTLETRLVDLAEGRFADGIDPAAYDPDAAADQPDASTALPPEADTAGLKRRADLAPVYLLEREGELELIVLPVHGQGYQSTIRAMLALQPDLVTVAALTILEQGETPGLGARIAEPSWQALWPGKEIADANGEIAISVVRGQASGPHEVDGITGATRTSNGVQAMLRFWLGDWGYGPFLERLRAEGL